MRADLFAICTRCRRSVRLGVKITDGSIRFGASATINHADAWVDEHLGHREERGGIAWAAFEIVGDDDPRLSGFIQDEPA